MHAASSGVGSVQYRVPHAYTVFIALIGLAREDKNPWCDGQGDARFRVHINGEIRLETNVMHFGQTKEVRIPVEENDIITLEVDNGGDDHTCDHSTWAEARFEP